MIKLATPISHLFEDEYNAKIIMDNSDCLECRDRTIDSIVKNQELFHCELQPIHDWTKEKFNYHQKKKENKQTRTRNTTQKENTTDATVETNIHGHQSKQYHTKKHKKNNT